MKARIDPLSTVRVTTMPRIRTDRMEDLDIVTYSLHKGDGFCREIKNVY